MNKKDTKVSILCMTYNHEKFIMDALKGFVMQATNFPFVAIVVDDASTDKEPDILWNFVNTELDSSSLEKKETIDYVKVVAPHKTNHKCTFVILFLKYNHKSIKKDKNPYFIEWQNASKYIAICEGDDYWISPLKLQKQVDFLETHPDYTLVYSNYKEDVGGNLIDGRFNLLEGNCLQDYLLVKGIVPTASTLFLKNNYMTAINKIPKGCFLMGDVPLWIQFMHMGKVKKIDDVTTVYRILPESASHSKDVCKKLRFNRSALAARGYYAKIYGYDNITSILEYRINIINCELALHEKRYFDFIKLNPWKYNFGIRKTLSIIKQSLKRKS